MEIPASPQFLDRIGVRLESDLFVHIGREHIFGDRIQQPRHVPEQPIDRRRLHAGRCRHRTGRGHIAAALREEARRRRHDAGAYVVAGNLRVCQMGTIVRHARP